MTLAILYITVGFVLLIKGADWMINEATLFAEKNNISDLIIGFTIVAFGTSATELLVNAVASSKGYSDIFLGNITGSNHVNLFLILGSIGLLYPIAVKSTAVKKEIPTSLIAAVLFLLLATNFYSENKGRSRIDGLLSLRLFVGFLFYRHKQIINEKSQRKKIIILAPYTKIGMLIGSGFLGLVIGGKLVVDKAVTIATSLGVSQKIIGLTIIAAGMSLTKLITTIAAAFKKNSHMPLGHIIG
jgi:cation:H+ antiporter